ncbi:hypothetical protein MMC18_002154 [Xylographa bjoerkii]|nr:hypothetical protein [Xylographa bjoerkii]
MSPVANRTFPTSVALPEASESQDLESPGSAKIWDCDVESCQTPSMTDAPTESPFETSDEHKEGAGHPCVGPDRKSPTPFVVSFLAKAAHSQTLEEQQVPPSTSEAPSRTSPTVLPITQSTLSENSQEPFSPIELFPHPSPLALPVPQSTPLPEVGADSYFEQLSASVPFSHPLLNSGSSTSVASKNPGSSKKVPRSFPVFRELPSDESSITNSATTMPNLHSTTTAAKIPTPIDVSKLPPPKILIIRATEDSVEASAAVPVAPDLFENADVLPKDMRAALPRPPLYEMEIPHMSQSDVGLPGVQRVSTALINDHLGAVDAVEIPVIPKAHRVKRRRTMVRKTRKVVLRSPVLTIILGRQLALMVRPALKLIAKGGDLVPVAALGDATEILGTL